MAVNVVQSALSSRRFNKWLPWFAGALLAAGVIAVLVAYFGNTANPAKETFGGPAQTPQVVKQVPLQQAARETAGRFILTAVARENLDEAWNLATPYARGGLTYKEWLTGEIPVVPMGVPIDKAVITKIIYSHAKSAEINIVIAPKTPNKFGVKDQLYVMDLKKVGEGDSARWLVDYCQPQASAGIPHQS
ncbi:MAG: hypothetical protein M3R26_02000 [Actinomycetota bacterium]|nr:hypothetical protein [Actinomycetota bacterium]